LKKKFKIKKTEEAVLQSEKRYHTLLEVSPGIFAWMLTDSTHVNPSWCQISGLSFQEAREWLLNAVHDDDKLLMVGKMKPLLMKS
jgi:PAS domain-containing protein